MPLLNWTPTSTFDSYRRFYILSRSYARHSGRPSPPLLLNQLPEPVVSQVIISTPTPLPSLRDQPHQTTNMSSMTGSSSFVVPPSHPSSTSADDDVDSLPSSSSDLSSDYDDNDAEREWRESLQQLELLLTMVVVPYLGKYFGRKCAYWSWAKFMEWKYPDVEVRVTSPATFKGAGAVAAAASL
ncbi:hypothetical protein HDK77DRAFT_498437 [Phyllosticta capitalensis]|uniref:Uncharacterized protein n=1 Tax=Phyllosticta capitalensis TaxID=121624 RepID=A0ABR1Z0T2_9PEZI